MYKRELFFVVLMFAATPAPACCFHFGGLFRRHCQPVHQVCRQPPSSCGYQQPAYQHTYYQPAPPSCKGGVCMPPAQPVIYSEVAAPAWPRPPMPAPQSPPKTMPPPPVGNEAPPAPQR